MLKNPVLKLFSKLKNTQFKIKPLDENPGIYSISTMNDENSSIQLLISSHEDDWTYENIQSISITFQNILFKKVLVKHWRIDSNHWNVYSKWIEIGKPNLLTDNQIQLLKNAQQLQDFSQPIELTIENNQLKLDPFPLPTHSISFIEIIRQDWISFLFILYIVCKNHVHQWYLLKSIKFSFLWDIFGTLCPLILLMSANFLCFVDVIHRKYTKKLWR